MEKLYSVQYLRALAALLVVVAHAFSYQVGVGNQFVVLAGEFGVQLFFVISGFIMVYISGTGPFSATKFLKRRVIRIVPLYWLFTILTGVLALAASDLFKTTVVSASHLIESLLFIAHDAPGRGGTSPLLTQGWTLNYEAFFYVVFATLALLTARSRVTILTLVFVALWLVGMVFQPTDPIAQFYLNTAPLGFAAGCLIGLLKTDRSLVSIEPPTTLLVAATIAGLLVALADAQPPYRGTGGFFGQLLTASGLLLLGIKFETRIGHRPVLKLLGDASYAIYLSHMFAIGAIFVLVRQAVEINNSLALIVVALLAAVSATFAGIAVHELIEKRIMRFFQGKSLATRLKPGTEPAGS